MFTLNLLVECKYEKKFDICHVLYMYIHIFTKL